jgi:hypothetical protein
MNNITRAQRDQAQGLHHGKVGKEASDGRKIWHGRTVVLFLDEGGRNVGGQAATTGAN